MLFIQCTSCKQSFTSINYSPSYLKRNCPICKTCVNIKQRDNYAKKLDEKKEYRRLQYLKNKEVINEKRKNSDSYMKHLIKKGIEFHLDVNVTININKISEQAIELQRTILKLKKWAKENS